jgi:hypothetical protein
MLLTSTGRRKRKARILLPLVGEGSLAKRGRMRALGNARPFRHCEDAKPTRQSSGRARLLDCFRA